MRWLALVLVNALLRLMFAILGLSMNVSLLRVLCLSVLMLLFCQKVFASVVVNGTRIIYPAESREVTVKLDNLGDSPSLVQAWVDDGDVNQTADNSDAPFFLTPPVSRVESGRSQTLRILFTGTSLPSDQESVFWLNVLEVPPSPESATGSENYLQVAFRSRLKLFYRPKGLSGNANSAPALLRWRLVDDRLQVENPSDYHISFTDIRALTDQSEVTLDDKGLMIAPKQTMEFVVPRSVERLRFITVNDYGGRVQHETRLDS